MDINEKDETQYELIPDLSLMENIEEEEETTEIEEEVIEQEAEEVEETELDESEVVAIQSFYQMLQEQNLVPEKEVNSWEDINAEIEAYKTSLPDQVKESILSSASQEAQTLLDYAITKPNATKEDLLNFLSADIEDQKVSAIETNEQAREYLQEELSKKYSEKVVTAMLDAFEDDEKLIEEAKAESDKQSQKLLEAAEQERLQNEEAAKQTYNNIIEEFEAQPWQKDHIANVKSQWSDGTLDNKIQQISRDPKSLVQLMNLLTYYDDKTKQFNLDTFFTKAKTKEVTSVRDRIKNSMQNKGVTAKAKVQKQGLSIDDLELVK